MRLDELLEHNETVRWTRKYKENDRWTQFGHGSDTAQDRRHDGDTSSRSIQMWRQDRSISSRLAALNVSLSFASRRTRSPQSERLFFSAVSHNISCSCLRAVNTWQTKDGWYLGAGHRKSNIKWVGLFQWRGSFPSEQNCSSQFDDALQSEILQWCLTRSKPEEGGNHTRFRRGPDVVRSKDVPEPPSAAPATQSNRGVQGDHRWRPRRPEITESHQMPRLPRKAAAASTASKATRDKVTETNW